MALNRALKQISLFPSCVAVSLMALWATPLQAVQVTAGERVEVIGEHDTWVMAAGNTVRLHARVHNDVVAAGGHILTSNTDAERIVTAGDKLMLTDATAGELVAAGNEIWLSRMRVMSDLFVAGGRIRMDSSSTISGPALIMGGDVAVAGTVAGDLTVSAERLRLDGRIGGHADLSAKRLQIGPGARIEGNLLLRARRIEISPDAEITGIVTARGYERRLTGLDILSRVLGGAVWVLLALILGCVALALALSALLPGIMAGTHDMLHRRTMPTLSAGILWAVGAPFAAALLMALVIGIPAGLFLFGVFVLSIPLSGAVVAHFLGREIRELIKRRAPEPTARGRVAWTLLGMSLLAASLFVPFASAAVPVLVFLLGSGAAVLVFLESSRTESQARGL